MSLGRVAWSGKKPVPGGSHTTRPCLCNGLAMRKLQTHRSDWGLEATAWGGDSGALAMSVGVFVVVVPMSHETGCKDMNTDTLGKPAM